MVNNSSKREKQEASLWRKNLYPDKREMGRLREEHCILRPEGSSLPLAKLQGWRNHSALTSRLQVAVSATRRTEGSARCRPGQQGI